LKFQGFNQDYKIPDYNLGLSGRLIYFLIISPLLMIHARHVSFFYNFCELISS